MVIAATILLAPIMPAHSQSNIDSDGDGISDRYERIMKTNPNDATSTPADLDKDGLPDAHDLDIDGDGVNNWKDPFPRNAQEYSDSDGDGVGDRNDKDSDGDGFTNHDETVAGTNPNNKEDFPDSESPVLTVTALPEVVTESQLIVSGMAFDMGMGVSKVQVVNEDGRVFKAHFNYATHWRTLVQLSRGENLLQVAVFDKANNRTRKVISVRYEP